VEKDNGLIAKDLLAAITASGSIAIPRLPDYVSDKGDMGWSVEVLEGQGRQAEFNERLRYLDTLKVRALLLPERMITEGTHGTLAESAVQTDTALASIQGITRAIVGQVNRQLVDRLAILHAGPAAVGQVHVEPTALDPEQVQFLRELYKQLLADPVGMAEQSAVIDTDAIMDGLGIPKAKTVATPAAAVPEPANAD
jgi:hypothetical protein